MRPAPQGTTLHGALSMTSEFETPFEQVPPGGFGTWGFTFLQLLLLGVVTCPDARCSVLRAPGSALLPPVSK